MNRFLSVAMGVVMLVMIAPTFLLTGCTSSSPSNAANNETFFIGAPTHGPIGWVNKNGTMAERNNGTATITTPNGKAFFTYTDTSLALITQEAGTPTKTCTLGENAMGNTKTYSCTESYTLNSGVSTDEIGWLIANERIRTGACPCVITPHNGPFTTVIYWDNSDYPDILAMNSDRFVVVETQLGINSVKGILGGAPPIRKVNIYTANTTANARGYIPDTTPALVRKTLYL